LAPDGNAFRGELGLRDGDIVAMYAGAVGPKQGLRILLDVAPRLPHVQFVVVGAGDEWLALKQMAEQGRLSNLRFAQTQPEDRLPEVINAADIHLILQLGSITNVVMPSKLANIYACARPVIATAAADTALGRVIEQSGGGILCPPDDAAALAQAVARLADDADRRSSLGRSGRNYAQSQFAMDAILPQLELRLAAVVSAR
ncbi:MAG TPA: glycosyltransferase, partial [Nevskiaceae bacterium]|nr:glycosyltransferase [Nevskiaceae bacterium]